MKLEVNKVNKSYGKQKVLKDVSFTIEEPAIMALVGPNGSGKSTLLSIITNLLNADSGEVRVLGKKNQNPSIFYDVSFMQDNTVLYDYLTGYDHLQFVANAQKLAKEQIIKTAEKIGITSYLKKRVRDYSLGMKQHLLLAMAVLNKPKLLILDEPLNGLDPTSAIKVRHLLLELKEAGTTILLSSHNLSEIDRITTDILFLKEGTLIQEDISIYRRVRYELKVDETEKALTALGATEFEVEKKDEDHILVYLDDFPVTDLMQIFVEQQITILDMEKKIVGSEERYKKIFGQKEKTL